MKNVMDDGVMVKKAATKYWNKWDGPGAAKTTERLNITRLLGEVLESRLTPLETKLKVAEASNKTACAKAFLKRHRVETHVPATDQPEVDALQAKAKAAKTGGDAHARQGRQATAADDRVCEARDAAPRRAIAARHLSADCDGHHVPLGLLIHHQLLLPTVPQGDPPQL